jgi:hypothetical protein
MASYFLFPWLAILAELNANALVIGENDTMGFAVRENAQASLSKKGYFGLCADVVEMTVDEVKEKAKDSLEMSEIMLKKNIRELWTSAATQVFTKVSSLFASQGLGELMSTLPTPDVATRFSEAIWEYLIDEVSENTKDTMIDGITDASKAEDFDGFLRALDQWAVELKGQIRVADMQFTELSRDQRARFAQCRDDYALTELWVSKSCHDDAIDLVCDAHLSGGKLLCNDEFLRFIGAMFADGAEKIEKFKKCLYSHSWNPRSGDDCENAARALNMPPSKDTELQSERGKMDRRVAEMLGENPRGNTCHIASLPDHSPLMPVRRPGLK